jgi:hypothetical protein
MLFSVLTSLKIEDFKTLNDRKARKDHETKNTCKGFWIRASAAHNACMETNTEIVVVEKAMLPARQGGSVVDPHAARPASQVITFPDSDDSSEDSSGGGKAHTVEQAEEEEVVVGAANDFVTIVVFPDNNEHLLELVSDLDVDLSNVDQ